MKALAGKKVLLIVENNAVPFDRRVWREALALQEGGAHVSVICPVFREDRDAMSVINGIEVFRYGLTFSNGTVLGYMREYFGAFFWTFILYHKVLMRRKRIHVVHVANPPDIFWPLALYVRLFGSKFIFDEHDLTPETYLSRFEKQEQRPGILYAVLKKFQLLSYKFSHTIISTNESYKQRTIETNPGYQKKVFVVRNGPDTRYFKRVPARSELKRGRKFMAAYIGIMAIQDGVDFVIRSLDVLVKKRGFNDLLVYLIGTGDDVPRLQHLVEEYQLQDYVVFTGRIPDPPALEILSTADICLSPDPYNPLNDHSTMNKVMEYMAVGKPLVSFDLKEARFSAGESALYVDNNSADAFAAGILHLLENPEICVRMSEFGTRRIDEALCWQRQSENLLKAYEFTLSI